MRGNRNAHNTFRSSICIMSDSHERDQKGKFISPKRSKKSSAMLAARSHTSKAGADKICVVNEDHAYSQTTRCAPCSSDNHVNDSDFKVK